jgi:hypothetical protein
VRERGVGDGDGDRSHFIALSWFFEALVEALADS